LANGIGVDEAHKEDKRYQMIVEDDGIECEIKRDDGPGYEVRNQSE
jgi:hypothetical protein